MRRSLAICPENDSPFYGFIRSGLNYEHHVRITYTSSGRHKNMTCTVLADSSHGDSHVGSVSPAATRTRTLALTLTLTRTCTLTLGGG